MSPKINVGCGMMPTAGWINYDNSPSVRLARLPFAARLLKRFGLINGYHVDYITFCSRHEIKFANAQRLPLAASSVSVVYSSHMFEHLDRERAAAFLREVLRVLEPGGMLRLVVPDLRREVDHYLETADADLLITEMHVCAPAPKHVFDRIRNAILGPRHHQWMYDVRSLPKLLESSGFTEVRVLPPGETGVPDPGALNLREREAESIYVEGRKALVFSPTS